MKQFLDECDYLIHLVRCALHHLQPAELPEELKFEDVYQWGEHHHIANIAFYSVEKLEKKPEPELYRKWQRCRDQAVVREINQQYAAQEIRHALQGAQIPWLEVQGTRIKPLYPQPDWRTMSDLDFIIHREQLLPVKQLLEALGYRCEDVHGEELNGHRYPNINVEMHTEFFTEDCPYRQVLSSPFASADETGCCDINTFYLYNILHIAKHYFTTGCGIRRVLDVYFLNREYGQLMDGAYVRESLERAKMTDFANELTRLANVWFGEKEQAPAEGAVAHCIKFTELHGNWIRGEKNALQSRINHTARFPKLQYFLHRLRGTKEDLQTRYPVLKKHRFLYPFCWLCRTFGVLRPSTFRRLRREVNVILEVEHRSQTDNG